MREDGKPTTTFGYPPTLWALKTVVSRSEIQEKKKRRRRKRRPSEIELVRIKKKNNKKTHPCARETLLAPSPPPVALQTPYTPLRIFGALSSLYGRVFITLAPVPLIYEWITRARRVWKNKKKLHYSMRLKRKPSAIVIFNAVNLFFRLQLYTTCYVIWFQIRSVAKRFRPAVYYVQITNMFLVFVAVREIRTPLPVCTVYGFIW